MKRAILIAMLLLASTACTKSIHLRPIPTLAGNGKAELRVELTYDRNNKLFVAVSGLKDGSYVIWTVPVNGEPVNVGRIRVEGGKGNIQTLTPLRKFTVMITQEEN